MSLRSCRSWNTLSVAVNAACAAVKPTLSVNASSATFAR